MEKSQAFTRDVFNLTRDGKINIIGQFEECINSWRIRMNLL